MNITNICSIAFFSFLFFCLIACVQCLLVDIQYDNDLGSYYNLAVESSTAELKLKYLQKYREEIKKHNLEHGYGAWLVKLPDKKLENQIAVLDSIIERLKDINKMERTSFEYQQALYQISRNELCHEGSEETAGCFKEHVIVCAYRLKYAFYIAGLAECMV